MWWRSRQERYYASSQSQLPTSEAHSISTPVKTGIIYTSLPPLMLYYHIKAIPQRRHDSNIKGRAGMSIGGCSSIAHPLSSSPPLSMNSFKLLSRTFASFWITCRQVLRWEELLSVVVDENYELWGWVMKTTKQEVSFWRMGVQANSWRGFLSRSIVGHCLGQHVPISAKDDQSRHFIKSATWQWREILIFINLVLLSLVGHREELVFPMHRMKLWK